MVTNPQIDAVAELTSTWRLLFNNWMLAIPNLIAMIIAAVVAIIVLGASFAAMGGVAALSNRPGGIAGILSLFSGTMLIVVIVAGLVFLVAGAATVIGAEDVWKGGRFDLGAVIGGSFKYLVNLIIAYIIIGIVIAILAITFIGPIIWGYFMMFVGPAIILGGHSAISAIGESWRMTTKSAGPSLMAFVGIIVVAILSTIVNMILGVIPIIGHILGLAVSILCATYYAMVVVRFYDLINGRATPAAAVAR